MKYLNSVFVVLMLLFSAVYMNACLSDGSGDTEDGDLEDSEVDSDSESREQPRPDGDADKDAFDKVEDEPESQENEEIEAEDDPVEFALKSVNALDSESVFIEFTMMVEKSYAEDDLKYYIEDESGHALDVLSIAFDEISGTVTLSTDSQKLGVVYWLRVRDLSDAAVNFRKDFISADTHTFWVADFSSPYYEMVQLKARRAALGEHCVIYVEKGYNIGDLFNALNEFDKKIYPIETENLIAAPDMDGNGKITILFLNGGNYYGGYFSPINAIPDEQAMEWWGIHSNGMEIIHINVLSDDDSVPGIIAHEFQHLLYHERHGFEADWEYHNEGMAESAVHMVYGEYLYNVNFYIYDPRDIIRKGLSLVNWQYAQYENYTLAYLFFTYLAGQLSGDTQGYIDIFNLENGSPEEMNALVQDRLGVSFMEAHHNSLVAFWAQHREGPYSFNGMIEMVPGYSPLVSAGTQSLDLPPFAGAVFRYHNQEISYPATAGSHIRYIGVNTDYEVDTEEPFKVGGGVLVAYNANYDNYYQWQKEHSGPDIAAASENKTKASQDGRLDVCEIKHIPAWADPPPINPDKIERWRNWLEATERRIAER